MAITLKIIFYLCCTWLIILTLSTLLMMVVLGMEYSREWNRQYFDNGFTYFAFVYTGVRLVESLIITRNKSI